MPLLLAAALCLATTSADATLPTSEGSANAIQAVRSPHTLHAAIRAAMRSEAIATTVSQQNTASRALCALYGEVQSNDLMSHRSRVQWADKIRSRFLGIKKKLEAAIAHKKDLRQTTPASTANPTISSTPSTGPAMGGQAQADDNGIALVELIQQTIRPDIWDVNGGQASIVYFAPLRALVVRAPGDAHRRADHLLNRLRAAGP